MLRNLEHNRCGVRREHFCAFCIGGSVFGLAVNFNRTDMILDLLVVDLLFLTLFLGSREADVVEKVFGNDTQDFDIVFAFVLILSLSPFLVILVRIVIYSHGLFFVSLVFLRMDEVEVCKSA